MGSSIDYLVYPNYLLEFFIIRIICTLISLLLLALDYTPLGRRYIKVLSQIWAFSLTLSFSSMLYLTEGAVSPYYTTFNIVILTSTVIMPWKLREAVFMSLGTLLIYIATCLLHHSIVEPLTDWETFATNGYFIFVFGAIGCTSSHFTTRARISDFLLRQELDSRNKELEDMDRLKSQFFANISHELRTPLTLILSPIQDLLQRPELLNDRVSSLMRTAKDNSLRLLKLVNDVLEVVKLEEGKTELSPQPIDITRFLKGILDSMSHMAEPRKIGFQKDLAKESIIIDADIYALERIFLNLLSNALKFTPEGGTITVSSSGNADTAVIEIADTGVGINKKDLPYIFDRFRQADGSSTRKYQGSGLGLALVKDLTEKMEGEIEAESEEGVGTVMRVSFPISQENADSEALDISTSDDWIENMHQAAEHRASLPIESPFGAEEAELQPGEKPSLLIVDDEPDMRKYLASILEIDYRVALARDGLQGLSLARELQPKMMVLDLMLPKLDGLEVCKQLKEDPATRSIKIVLLTARMDETAKITALKNGADDFLTKPFSRTEVETRLGNLLQTADLEANLVERNHDLEETLAELKTTQSNLIQSEKLNALGSLAAGLLHEVNNPLNYVITALQLIKKEPEVERSEDLRDYFEDIDEGVDRIKNIVSDLHTFAHPSAVDIQKTFSFTAALDSALRFTAQDCKGIIISKSHSKGDALVGSQGHVIQVLVNLLTNAARAVKGVEDKQQREIQISTTQKKDRLFISVEDNGVGMTEETRQRVFEPFFTTQDVGKGMGLGLSICHTISQNHGGKMEVESKLGSWTRFTFDIPIADALKTEAKAEELPMEIEAKN